MVIENKDIDLNFGILENVSEITFSDKIESIDIVELIKRINIIENESKISITINLKPLNIQKIQEILSLLLKYETSHDICSGTWNPIKTPHRHHA